PLAIELAATRARLLSPAVLLSHLESALGALPLLVGGARDLPARQQTLRGAIGWSYDLLDPDERRLVQRLAVFDGGFTPEAGGAQAFWLERLDLEQENLRAALTWSLDEGEVETALRLGGALWRFWYTRGYLSEGRHWLDRALTADAGAPTLARASALAGAGIL